MGVKVTFSEDFVEKLGRKLYNSGSYAENALANIVMKDTDQFVPMLNGKLRGGTKVIGGTIIYPGPYARYLYEGKLMVDPETGSSWAKKGKRKVLKDKNLVLAHSGADPNAQPHWFEFSKALNEKKWAKAAGRLMKRELKG